MAFVRFDRTGDPAIPAVIHAGEYTTPVWIQSSWTQGEYAQYIRRNGCGHCCTAMAANLRGVETDPYRCYMLCRELWGAPREDLGQDHFQTVAGIVKILAHLGVNATCYGVAEGEQTAAAAHILSCLKRGEQVAFICDPFRNPGDPFSTGYHYVLAVGLTEDGEILIANSSEKVVTGGIQTVTLSQVENALYRGGTADPAMIWGQVAVLHKGCTYVVIHK